MKNLIFTTLVILAATTSAHALEECSRGAKSLYKDIQIYNQTEKLMPNEGLVGDRLAKDLVSLRMEDSIKGKVQALETGFARCEVYLDSDDELEIMVNVEAAKKMKNPLITD